MILYHGTYLDFNKIDLSKCEPYKDFAKGFYTTTIYPQAVRMAQRKAKIHGGVPVVITYEVCDDVLELKDLNVKQFASATKDWAVFVINNRNIDFNDFNSTLCNTDFKYDVVYGPVANDTLTTLIERFTKGYIDSTTLIKEMEYHAPSNQYSFHTEKAVKLLKKVKSEWI